jgi:hypothetical protein
VLRIIQTGNSATFVTGAPPAWGSRLALNGSGTRMAGGRAPYRALTSAHLGTHCHPCDMKAAWVTVATNPTALIPSSRGEYIAHKPVRSLVHSFTKKRGSNSNVADLYRGSARFESRPGQQ